MAHDIDYQLNKLPKCPHCGHDLPVWSDDNPVCLNYEDEGRTTWDCPKCEQTFVSVTRVEYRFDTAVSEEAADNDEWGPASAPASA